MTMAVVDRIIKEVPRDFHISGSLSPNVLRRIAELHREVDAKVSAETGCGLTTLILSQLSQRHTSFTVDFGDSLPNTRNHSLFNAASTTFVVNPTQVSLPQWKFAEPLDFVILDGPHAYPFPDLEYFHVYPHVCAGGVLVIDDIHIPTIGHLYDFLRDDEMWEHVGDVETTAFFKRTRAPLLDPHGDGWPSQRYNRRYFAYPDALNHMYGEGWHAADFGREGGAGAPRMFVSTQSAREELITALAEKEVVLRRREAELLARLEASDAALLNLQSEFEAVEAKALSAETAVSAIWASTSWRVTAPLRALKRALKPSL